MLLNNIHIILCETSHPGNIGATARAMKNMGLQQLVLVAPKQFPHKEALDRASGADDILENAKVVSSLHQAIADCQWVYGTSARERTFAWPQLTPKQVAEKVQQQISIDEKVAIIFGPEQSGLTNEDLQLCDYHLAIPANPEYSSLNLGQAVQIVTYEIYQAFLDNKDSLAPTLAAPEKATAQSIAQLLAQFERVAIDLDFMDPKNPKKLLPRVQRLLAKAQLETEEVNILRGFLKRVEGK